MVLSDDPGASDRISQYSEGTSRWMVAVRMVSEGVDVPRLSVGVYATSASTPLFFAQAAGRFVRSRRAGETASIFLPSVPNLLLLASEMEAQRNHVLGKPHRESDGLDDEALEAAQKRKDEKSELENGFKSSARTPSWTRSSSTAHPSAPQPRPAATRKPTTWVSLACSTPRRCEICCGAGRMSNSPSARPRPRCRAARRRRAPHTASCGNCAVNSTLW